MYVYCVFKCILYFVSICKKLVFVLVYVKRYRSPFLPLNWKCNSEGKIWIQSEVKIRTHNFDFLFFFFCPTSSNYLIISHNFDLFLRILSLHLTVLTYFTLNFELTSRNSVFFPLRNWLCHSSVFFAQLQAYITILNVLFRIARYSVFAIL